MVDVFEKVIDAIDIETFVLCDNEDQGKKIAVELMSKMGFKDINIVFAKHKGPGARIRARGYIYKPGDNYGWLETFKKEGSLNG